MHALSALGVCALLMGLVNAGPIPKEIEEVIPGPGMPSLEELGLTSADLYEMSPVPLNSLEQRALVKRATCRLPGTNYCQTGNAQACVNYLNSLGTRNCVAQWFPPSDMCVAGQCHIYGKTIGTRPFTASSYCRDVAAGAQNVVNNCQRDGYTAGTHTAGGNGGFVVDIRSGAYS